MRWLVKQIIFRKKALIRLLFWIDKDSKYGKEQTQYITLIFRSGNFLNLDIAFECLGHFTNYMGSNYCLSKF